MNEMTNQVIQTLDYLFAKFGLAVDWSAENVLPMILELMGKYRTYSIVTSALGVVLDVVGLYIIAKLFLRINSCLKKREEGLFVDGFGDPSALSIVVFVVGTVLSVVLFIAVFGDASNLLKWVFVPEVEFVKVVGEMVGGA